MGYVGFDVFFEAVDSVALRTCRVCGSACDVERGASGPTGYASAVGRIHSRHDVFRCPHSGKKWHAAALALVTQMLETPSARVRNLIEQDWHDVLATQGISM